MNYFENEYALPIILGSSKEAILTAKTLQKKTDLEIHVIAKRLSLLNRLRFYFHRLCSDSEDIILMTAEDIARGFDDYYTPILIYDEKRYGEIISKNSPRVEAAFVVIKVCDFEKHFTQGREK